jgi:glutamate/tyrosine decarboxylase-like PLP-dependent enzyme
MPMILAANAGSYAIGQCDDLNQLNQISYKYKMWIHLEGAYLSTLVLNSVPTEIQVKSF